MGAERAHPKRVIPRPPFEARAQPTENGKTSDARAEQRNPMHVEEFEGRREHSHELRKGVESGDSPRRLDHERVGIDRPKRSRCAMIHTEQAARVVELDQCGPVRHEDSTDLLERRPGRGGRRRGILAQMGQRPEAVHDVERGIGERQGHGRATAEIDGVHDGLRLGSRLHPARDARCTVAEVEDTTADDVPHDQFASESVDEIIVGRSRG